jgi:hypothetical protein
MAKKLLQHKDKIGQAVEIGKVVAYPVSGTQLGVGIVEKIHNIMITVKSTTDDISWRREVHRYPAEVVVINDIPETLMYLLTKQ